MASYRDKGGQRANESFPDRRKRNMAFAFPGRALPNVSVLGVKSLHTCSFPMPRERRNFNRASLHMGSSWNSFAHVPFHREYDFLCQERDLRKKIQREREKQMEIRK